MISTLSCRLLITRINTHSLTTGASEVMYKFVWNQYRPPLGLGGEGGGKRWRVGLRLARERVKPGLIWKWLAPAPFTHQGINTPVRSGWHPPLTIRDTPRCSTPSQGYRPAKRDQSLRDQVLFNKAPQPPGEGAANQWQPGKSGIRPDFLPNPCHLVLENSTSNFKAPVL